MTTPTPETSLTDDELLQQRLDQMAAGLQAALETPDNEWGDNALEDFILDESLAWRFTADSRGYLVSMEWPLCLGGPNIWLNTDGWLEGYWGFCHLRRFTSFELAERLWEIAEDLYDLWLHHPSRQGR